MTRKDGTLPVIRHIHVDIEHLRRVDMFNDEYIVEWKVDHFSSFSRVISTLDIEDIILHHAVTDPKQLPIPTAVSGAYNTRDLHCIHQFHGYREGDIRYLTYAHSIGYRNSNRHRYSGVFIRLWDEETINVEVKPGRAYKSPNGLVWFCIAPLRDSQGKNFHMVCVEGNSGPYGQFILCSRNGSIGNTPHPLRMVEDLGYYRWPGDSIEKEVNTLREIGARYAAIRSGRKLEPADARQKS